MTSHKTCTKCGQEKEATTEFFGKRSDRPDGLTAYCIVCKREDEKKRYYGDHDKRRERARNRYRAKRPDPAKGKAWLKTPAGRLSIMKSELKRHYGITPEDYGDLMDKQKGACAVCGDALVTHDSRARPHVDHDHDTGVVRSLLCHGCNTGIGCLQDNPDVVLKAHHYLLKHKGE